MQKRSSKVIFNLKTLILSFKHQPNLKILRLELNSQKCHATDVWALFLQKGLAADVWIQILECHTNVVAHPSHQINSIKGPNTSLSYPHACFMGLTLSHLVKLFLISISSLFMIFVLQ